MRMGFAELAVILCVVLIFGGYKVLPKIAENLKASKKILQEEKDENVESTETVKEAEA